MVDEANIVKIVLYIACNYGVLTKKKEAQLVKLSLKNSSSIDQNKINYWIKEFFKEPLLPESYCEKISCLESRLVALKIATQTASVNGLDPKENLVCSRVMNYSDISWEEIASA